MTKTQNRIKALFLISLAILSTPLIAQTTFTESAAAYGLNIGGAKDGGHAWADYDGDGDLDVLVLVNSTSQRNYLLRNNRIGAGTNDFTNVQPTLVPGMLNRRAERQAAWGDVNNDGRPDFMMNSYGTSSGTVAIQIFIQNADGTFGDGTIGSTVPITVGENASATVTINPLNTEGAGFFDFEGDGDLDIFFDSHDYGIELLRNNYINHTTHTIVNPAPASLYTHITTSNGSPNVDFGLNQFATDGDYGTAADVNDDGWVDIFMRKRDENDFFLNQGGLFTNGADLGQASNNNKGANGLWDLDNDGDLDAVWTENGTTQIFRNDGSGVWTALGGGVFPSLPQPLNTSNTSSSAVIDALAGGDIDNDGDIDIILVGNSRSYLYINQLNSPSPAPGTVGSGAAMTFALDGTQSFNVGANGEGTTMVDVDDDGDLDIYMNISGTNRLYINNLAAANRNNHLIVNVTEDRNPDGTVGGFSGRTAIGTNVLIKDCDGNIISGLRQVNGVFGHGTQQSPQVHFGLPLGENQPYLIEVHYPNLYNSGAGAITRLIATGVAQPSTIAGTNHYTLTTTDAEFLQNPNAPIANDDLETVSYGNTVSVQISLFDNDSEPDGDNFFIESVTQPALGSVVIDDADAGLVTYTYSAATVFTGTTFTYTISDATVTVCPGSGKNDTATVTIYEPCADSTGVDTDNDGINDVCDLDDDNDGILDIDEGCGNVVINGSYEQDDFTDVIAYPGGFTGPNGTFIGTTYNNNVLTGWTYTQNMDGWVGGSSIWAPAFNGVQYLDLVGNNNVTGGVSNELTQIVNTEVGKSYSFSFYWGEDIGHAPPEIVTLDFDVIDSSSNSITSGTLTANSVGAIAGIQGPNSWFYYEETFVATTTQTTIWFRATPPGAGDTSAGAALDFVNVSLAATADCTDTDGDGIPNAFDLDSDNDGIFDAVEAGHGQAHTNGVVNGSVGTDGIPDAVQASPNDENTNYTIAESTDDSDTIPNYLDLDADGDGIPDNVEAQTTTGYISPSGTVDANGVDTNYTSGLNPTNTDSADNPDYLDTDSDNEGGNDTTEAGITLTNTDTDNDGLDNATDATADYSDPGGTIDDPLAGAVTLPDIDNDATTGGDVDFRDAENDADLSLTKTVSDAQPDQGDTITFTLTISNAGPSAPTSIIVRDIIPTDVTYTHPNFSTTQGTVIFNAGTREFQWDLGAFVLGAGNTITLTYTVTVDVCGEFTNQAEIINSSLADPDSTPNFGG